MSALYLTSTQTPSCWEETYHKPFRFHRQFENSEPLLLIQTMVPSCQSRANFRHMTSKRQQPDLQLLSWVSLLFPFFVETGSHEAQTSLNSRFACFYFPSAGTIAICQHTWPHLQCLLISVQHLIFLTQLNHSGPCLAIYIQQNL